MTFMYIIQSSLLNKMKCPYTITITISNMCMLTALIKSICSVLKKKQHQAQTNSLHSPVKISSRVQSHLTLPTPRPQTHLHILTSIIPLSYANYLTTASTLLSLFSRIFSDGLLSPSICPRCHSRSMDTQ